MTRPSVLVTGATGLVGEAVSAQLEALPATVHTSSRTVTSNPNHHVADLLSTPDVDALLNEVSPDVLIHLGGGRSGDARELRRANVETTRELLEGVARTGTQPYVVVAGSAAEYGESAIGPIGEEAPLRPVSDYGRAKVEQTTLAGRLCREATIPLTVVRPFNVVSPRLPPSTALGNMRAQLFEQTGAQRTLRCGRLDVVRDYVPVSFVAEAFAKLARSRSDEPVLNVCSGVGIELGDIVVELAAALGVDLAVELVEELAGMPAAGSVVGDPRRLAALGLRCRPTAATVAATMLAE